MSLSVLLWLLLFATFTVLALTSRPSWGISLYMLTYFAAPSIWWWGAAAGIGEIRWNLIAAGVLLAAVCLRRPQVPAVADPLEPLIKLIAVLILANAALVHTFLAPNWDISAPVLVLVAKYTVLFFCVLAAIRDRRDLELVLFTLLIGMGYLGYEATINLRGEMEAGRLDGFGTPSASSANYLANLVVTFLPALGGLLLAGPARQKLAAFLVLPFILNLILLCNSRGAFLALIAAAVVLLLISRGPARRRAAAGLALAGIGTMFLLGDERIVERFLSTFASEEERDASASSRLLYWRLGLRVAAAHPFGAGGKGYQGMYGPRELARLGHIHEERSVHNGYINEACEWGFQGLLLKASFILCGCWAVWRTVRRLTVLGDAESAFLGCCLISGLAAFLLSCLFGDFLDSEWAYWWVAIGLGYVRICHLSQ